jgi:hypothetical protein
MAGGGWPPDCVGAVALGVDVPCSSGGKLGEEEDSWGLDDEGGLLYGADAGRSPSRFRSAMNVEQPERAAAAAIQRPARRRVFIRDPPFEFMLWVSCGIRGGTYRNLLGYQLKVKFWRSGVPSSCRLRLLEPPLARHPAKSLAKGGHYVHSF